LTRLSFALISRSKSRDIKMVDVFLTVADIDLISMNTSAEDVGSLKVQHELKAAWEKISPDAQAFAVPTIEDAVNLVRSWAGEKEVFVTGSLHLIGGLYVILDEGQDNPQ
jgi:folylpolyglutamate synthase/dihydropteroate synthase